MTARIVPTAPSASCRLLCHGPGTAVHPQYENGDRYCRSCDRTWRSYPGIWCRCCNNRLRCGPYKRASKDRLARLLRRRGAGA